MKREFVTPFVAMLFVIVGVSGILMFFHLLDNYTNLVHEFLGLAFFLFAVFHFVGHWKSIENYAKKKQLLIPSAVVLVISATFIVVGATKDNPKKLLLDKLMNAPVYNSFKILGIDYKHAESLLKARHITLKDSTESILDISKRNKQSPKEIVEVLLIK